MMNDNAPEEEYYSDASEANHTIPPADIVSYTELRSVADLFRMYKQGDLDIQPDFQREEVWNKANQTRFIDSLIKQLPIPSLCLSFDFKKQSWQVVDGLQRLTSVFNYLDVSNTWKLSNVSDVDQRIAGKTNTDFDSDPDLNIVKRTVENTVLPITVVRCDSEKGSHREFLFSIFKRLNTGGVKLTNQEIRNCVYAGPLNTLLNEINQLPLWLSVSPFKKPTGNRFRGQEMILRVFAFSDSYRSYQGNLAAYLNDYMDAHRMLDRATLDDLKTNFVVTLNAVATIDQQLLKDISKTVFEAILVGIYLNEQSHTKDTAINYTPRLKAMLNAPEFSKENLSEGLAAKEKLISRLDAAVRYLGNDC